MIYNFHIPDEGNKKAEKLFKRVGKISFMVNNGFFIFTGAATLAFVGVKFANNFVSLNIANGHNLLLLALSFCFGGFITSLCNAMLNEHGTYRKLCKILKCPVFVNDMDTKLPNQEDAEVVDGIIIPDIIINYDVDITFDDDDNDKKQTALLVKVNKDTHKIITLLNTDKTGKKKKVVIPSKIVARGLDAAYEENDMVILRVCQFDKQTNGFIKDSDIDSRLVVEEAFMQVYSED